VLPRSLLRLSGSALVVAAAMFIVADMLAFAIFVEAGADYDLKQIAQTDTFFLQSLLTLLAGALLLGGMVGLYVGQSEEAGKLGLVGFVLAFLGTVLVEGDFYANTFITPLVAREAPGFLDDPLSGFLQVWLPLAFTVLGLSWLVLAVATVRAKVYPRAASWLLLVGALMALVPFPLVNIPFVAALGWLGLGLRRRPKAEAPRQRKSKSKR
jgi:hypothetical protein